MDCTCPERDLLEFRRIVCRFAEDRRSVIEVQNFASRSSFTHIKQRFLRAFSTALLLGAKTVNDLFLWPNVFLSSAFPRAELKIDCSCHVSNVIDSKNLKR